MLVPVDASYGDGVRAAVAEALPQATFVEQGFGDHYVDAQGGRRPVASTPPDWANVFTWTQKYAVDDPQYFDVTSYWDSVPAESTSGCRFKRVALSGATRWDLAILRRISAIFCEDPWVLDNDVRPTTRHTVRLVRVDVRDHADAVEQAGPALLTRSAYRAR